MNSHNFDQSIRRFVW